VRTIPINIIINDGMFGRFDTRIDYVLHNLPCPAVRVEHHSVTASDHRPVTVTFRKQEANAETWSDNASNQDETYQAVKGHNSDDERKEQKQAEEKLLARLAAEEEERLAAKEEERLLRLRAQKRIEQKLAEYE
jgi:hypothetical protein